MTKCEATVGKEAAVCGKRAKFVAERHGTLTPVCGVHARQHRGWGWRVDEVENFADLVPRRAVSGWIMVPVHVVADLSGLGRIVQTHFEWEHTRAARDDFDDPVGMEICEPMPDSPFWQGVDEKKDGKYTGRMERPTDEERKHWMTIAFNGLEAWVEEEEGVVTNSGSWVPYDYDYEVKE